jgi:lipopolysaccharide transport protein LptA
MKRQWFIMAAIMVTATCGWAGEKAGVAASTNETVITSRRLDFDYPKKTAIFDGDVVVTDVRVTIKADQMTALFSTNNQPEMIMAVGNVVIDQEDRMATCERATYSVKSGLLVLTGKPVVKRGAEVMSGSRIIFSRDDDKVKCEDAVLRISPGQSGLKGGFDDVMKKR